MSEIQVGQINSTDGSTAITTGADGYVSFAKTQIGGRRNLIINGAMQVAQRGTSFTSDGYTLDRFYWQAIDEDELAFTVTKDSNAPTGFASSLKVVATTAESSWAATEFARFFYKIEAQDLQHLDYGASTAKSVTMSFWVKSDVTGAYSVSFYVPDTDRRIGSTYTINSADTWEYKTITFVGDTSGSINNDNGEGIQISFCLAAGSNYTVTDNTSWAANSDANTFYGHTASWGTTINDNWAITGVQLEVGTVATPFEHRSYGEELALCQRYYYVLQDSANKYVSSGEYVNTNELGTTVIYPVMMRSSPTLKQTTGTDYYYGYSGGYDWFNNWQGIDNNSRRSGYVYANTSQVSGTTGKAVKLGTGSGGFIAFESEL